MCMRRLETNMCMLRQEISNVVNIILIVVGAVSRIQKCDNGVEKVWDERERTGLCKFEP